MTEETIYLGKPAAALSYFTFIGLIIAFFMNNEAKNPFAAFHIRQSLGLVLGYVLIMLPLGFFDSWLISGPFILTFFVLWLFGLITAFQGKTTPVPLVGKLFQKMFTTSN